MDCKGHESIGKWISTLHRYGRIYISKELNAYGIGSGQFIFLHILFQGDGIHQETLANSLNMDKGTTARAVKKLEEEGYVVRKVDPEDRRAYKIYVTEKALELKPIFKRVLSEWTDILSEGLTEEEQELTLHLLKKMSQNVAMFIKENEV